MAGPEQGVREELEFSGVACIAMDEEHGVL
jgi:hypothetical protein